jgi:ferric-dicitrate binding protein FerR (iron transport regulator)
MKHQENFRELIELLLSNRISPEQKKKLSEWIDQPEYREDLYALIKDSYYLHADDSEDSMENALEFLSGLKQKMAALPPATIKKTGYWRPFTRWAAAAVLVLTIGAGAYFFSIKKKVQPIQLSQAQRFTNDVQPGGNKAILILADKSAISLDDAKNGELASQGGSSVTKKDGAVQYNKVAGKDMDLVYNTIRTPSGGQYQLTLSDGTKVWLDSRSSIHFPTVFQGASREVDITGQVYFEIAGNPRQPFIIKAKDQQVQVLGTAVNINAFDSAGGVTTTLAEGAVNVLEAGSSLLLKPGQGAQIDAQGSLLLIPHPDMEETLAWKDGLFHFNGSGITTIMDQVARWYDVEVIYKNEIQGSFVADIPRSVPISKLLILLELTKHVHFLIEGKKITVMK